MYDTLFETDVYFSIFEPSTNHPLEGATEDYIESLLMLQVNSILNSKMGRFFVFKSLILCLFSNSLILW